jgi:hypothetical protein
VARPVEATAAEPSAGADVEGAARAADTFAARVRERQHRWRATISSVAGEGRRAAVWGGGSKAVSFLTALELGDEISCVVDINPRKQGTFVPGTGHPIVAPEALSEFLPHVVFVMNPVYRSEIAAELRRIGLAPELISL